MTDLKTRKRIRLENYDYSTPGMYFITVCTKNRQNILWNNVRTDIISPDNLPLSSIGITVEHGILQINNHYDNVEVNKYCIMPDHIHLIIFIYPNESGRMVSAPTISTIVGSMKRWTSKQTGKPIWQKSFIDRIIRNEKGYQAVWEYIENNPLKTDTSDDMPDFDNM